MPDVPDMISLEYCETLSDVSIDNYAFKITWHPANRESCILWFRDVHVSSRFEALGQFTHFDKRKVLQFVVRYATSAPLREEVDKRRFTGRVATLDGDFFADIERMGEGRRIQAFRQLFDLDNAIQREDLARKWRVLAKKYHPDAGGNDRIMGLINEAYELLLKESRQ